MGILSKLFGSEKKLKRLRSIVEEINGFEGEVENLSDEELRKRSDAIKEMVRSGEKQLDDVRNEAFALVRETARRTLEQRHYDVQLMGGIVIHEGDIAEMKTGEGKTLASTSPVYLNALEGKGVHVVTVNDYLATRDAVWMGQIYHALGLSVACLTHDGAFIYDPEHILEHEPLDQEDEEVLDEERDEVGSFKVQHEFLRPISRKDAYLADITYGTNHEFGFDYLRDNMVYDIDQKVQRGHHFVVIDEIDSVLIDEARTPMIISAPDKQSSELYKTFAGVARRLKKDEDYEVDEKFRSVNINDNGIEKVENILGIDNIYDPDNFKYVHYLEEALRARGLFKRDKDYVVKGNEVVIVDQNTGRLMHGRRYSGGLHQAIEAKENVLIKEESKTVASITIQNYFRMYEKLSGMTGTAETSSEEFYKVYGLDVVVVPTHRPLIREALPDLVYKTQKGKFEALVRHVKERHEKGQPILIGTVAIEKNEVVSVFLKKAGIKHEVLNAKNHEREGEIIAQAGSVGAVTVATNMAGRGVDIVLGGNPLDREEQKKVKELGGLHVIGTERHDSRRIDNQLRGRAGRQGDPGSSQFLLSLEDDLLRVFGGDRLQNMMNTFRVPEDQPIESKMVTKAIESAQEKVEGFNFDARKHTLQYDDVLNKQRDAVYERRDRILRTAKEGDVGELVEEFILNHTRRIAQLSVGDMKKALVQVGVIESEEDFDYEIDDYVENREGVEKYIEDLCLSRLEDILDEEKKKFLKAPLLQLVDQLWMGHLENIEALRQSVKMRAYGQHDPLVEFKKESHRLFQNLFAQYEAMLFSIVFKFNVTPRMKSNALQRDLAAKKNLKTNRSGTKGAGGNKKGKVKKVGRNDPCPCGATKKNGKPKKYKHCHGR